MKVHVVHGTTESGDDWLLVFAGKPTEDQIEQRIKAVSWLREEWEAECIQGWRIDEAEVYAGAGFNQ